MNMPRATPNSKTCANSDTSATRCGSVDLGCRRRRSQPNGLMAVQGEERQHATGGERMDILARGVLVRNLVQPGPGRAISYVDYSSMEFLVAAARSGDALMLKFYEDDPYLSFAKHIGAAPIMGDQADAWPPEGSLQNRPASDSIWCRLCHPRRQVGRLPRGSSGDDQPAS